MCAVGSAASLHCASACTYAHPLAPPAAPAAPRSRTAHATHAESLHELLAQCEPEPPQPLDPPETLRDLYGSGFDAAQQGTGQVLILGNHNTGTSMLVRLVMLMGLFHGDKAGARPSGPARAACLRGLQLRVYGVQCAAVASRCAEPVVARR